MGRMWERDVFLCFNLHELTHFYFMNIHQVVKKIKVNNLSGNQNKEYV